MYVTGLRRYIVFLCFPLQKPFFFQAVKRFCIFPSVKNRTRPLSSNLYRPGYPEVVFRIFEFVISEKKAVKNAPKNIYKRALVFRQNLTVYGIPEYGSSFAENRIFSFRFSRRSPLIIKASAHTHPTLRKYNKHFFDVDT